MKRSMIGIFIALIAVIAIAALVISNRSKDTAVPTTTNSTTTDSQTQDQTPTSNTGTAPAAEVTKVNIANHAFSPATIKVKKGTKVTWTNQDSVGHTVTPDDEGAFTPSGTLSKGGTYSVTFDKVGTFGYHCTPHPDMMGTVEVTES